MDTLVSSKDQVLSILQAHDTEIKALGVKRLRLFGSFLRGDQNAESDVDLLVEFEPGKKNHDNLRQLGDLLQDLLGRRVELVLPELLDPYIGPYILREVKSGGAMKTRKSPIPYLRHILDEATYLIERSEGLTQAKFRKDSDLQRAFVRSLEIIGEAAKKVPTEFRAKYIQVEWKGMTGMRDRLIHEYDTVDYDQVWKVVSKEIPVLKAQIDEILEKEAAPKSEGETGSKH